MRRIFVSACLFIVVSAAVPVVVRSQDTAGVADSAASRALTQAEYEKAKTFTVSDLDKDSYVKFENAYILDRHDFGKPYFITGDDGLKKRIDLYKLILKEGRVDLGTVIYYTTEKGQRYTACLPGFNASPEVWGKYFGDIHAIDKEEKNFVLKLSYVLSKELGYQLYRSAALKQGKDLAKEREAGTYGNDICFPGDMQVSLAGGDSRSLKDIRPGDAVVTVDPLTQQAVTVKVKELAVHTAKNYAITRLVLLSASEEVCAEGGAWKIVSLRVKTLQATPNHPMRTITGQKKIGEIVEGDKVLCLDERTGNYLPYTVWERVESAGGEQKVYNIVAEGGSTLLMNGVMVLQK